MLEQIAFWFIVTGITLLVLGWIWLLIRAWRQSVGWGLLSTLVPPCGVFFAATHYPRVRGPVWTLVTAITLIGVTYGGAHLLSQYINYQPIVTIDERNGRGETHLTLTDAKNFSYADIANYPQLTVLQMANPDVTDETLAHVADLTELTEIDLNDTQITDAGLAILAKLPKLRIVRLRGTKITDEGFRTHLLPLTEIIELDLRETPIKSATLRQWKTQFPDERKYLK
ncbi:MAG: hypothetical protein SFX18_04890 [Pirellulales bacterium]|nr:hypothetical protein [Pirellulales bacterium]